MYLTYKAADVLLEKLWGEEVPKKKKKPRGSTTSRKMLRDGNKAEIPCLGRRDARP